MSLGEKLARRADRPPLPNPYRDERPGYSQPDAVDSTGYSQSDRDGRPTGDRRPVSTRYPALGREDR